MSRLWIVVGDSTSHGGTVLNGDAILSADGKPVARIGDMVACPKCKGVFPIVSGAGNFIGSNGQLVARQGDSTACGATLVPGEQGHGVWDGMANADHKETSANPATSTTGPAMPRFDEEIRFLDPVTGKPAAGMPYRLHLSDGSVFEGQSCEQGLTPRFTSDTPANIVHFVIGTPNAAA